MQGFPSSHGAPFRGLQTPPVHVSWLVQALLSLQAKPSALLWLQPLLALHGSLVQGLLSSQLVAPPPTHAPLLHTSPTVQGLLSSQTVALLAVWPQPLTGSQ